MTTNSPDGVSTNFEYQGLGAFGLPDPTKYHTFWNDFDKYDAGTSGVHDWLATIVGTTPTAVLNDANNGILLVTLSAADNDYYAAQWNGSNSANVAEIFAFVAGKQSWGKFRFKISDATQSDFAIGLYITDTDPIGGLSDGVYFLKSDGAATVSLVVNASSTATTTSVGTLADDTYVTLGWWYNGVDKIVAYLNDVAVAVSAITNLPTTEIAPSFVIQNGEAVAKILNLDYMLIAQER
jgi:hypothetical protein